MRLTILLSFLLFSARIFAQGDTLLVDKIVGVVGDKVVLLSDVELQYQQMLSEGDLPEGFKCELMNQMLGQKMFLEQALVDSLVVSDDEIESELDRRIRYFINMIGSQEKLEQYYEKSILEIKDEFREDIRQQLLGQKMQGQIYADVQVTPSDVKAFYNDIPKDSLPYFNAEVEIGQIVFYPKMSESQKTLAKAKAQGLYERIQNGEDFCILAISYSEDPGSVDNCGDLGWVGRGEFVTEFEAVAFRMEPNEVSEPFESPFGWHIVQMLEKKGNRIHARHILVTPRFTSFDIEDAKRKADSVRSLLVSDSLTFTKAVTTYSEDENTMHQGGMLMNPNTGNYYFEVSQLDKELYFAIEGLKVGEYSVPLSFKNGKGNQAYRIVYLKSETAPHVANLKDDYYRIKAAAENQKQDEALNQWLNEKIEDTYIYVDPAYNTCPSMAKWYKKNSSSTSYE